MPKDLTITLSLPTDGDPLPHVVCKHGEYEIAYDSEGELQGGSDDRWAFHWHLGLPIRVSTRKFVSGDVVIEEPS